MLLIGGYMKKVRIFYEKIEKIWEKSIYRDAITEYIYLIIFAVYMFFYFTTTTMFNIMWPENFAWVLRLILLIFVVMKLATQNKGIDLKTTIFIALSMTLFLAVWHRTGYVILYDTILLLVGAYNVYYKKILKVYLLIAIPFTIYTIIASQLGLVVNLIYNQEGRIRESFGFVYPTDFAARIFFIFVAWILIRELKCTIGELLFMLLTVCLLNVYSDTRCSEITIILLAFGIFILKVLLKKEKYKKLYSIFANMIRALGIIIPLMATVLMTLLCRFYIPSNPIMAFLNKILSERLKLGKKIFDYYDIPLMGQYILMSGNGGTTEKPEDYTYIDCSYLNILMRFGVLIFIVTILILWIIVLKNYSNMVILGTLIIICIHSMIEHHMLEFYYNIFIILPLATFNNEDSAINHKKHLIEILARWR